MKTLLEAIQKHPDTFIHTLQHRQFTSVSNKEVHQKMIDAIDAKDWESVSESLTDAWYRKPLEGVVFCLKMDYDFTEKSKIIKLFKKGKLV
tara:strand:+ start:663 stop:935 length:273 start_codon:yes stop_codon:yes gene_type:complete